MSLRSGPIPRFRSTTCHFSLAGRVIISGMPLQGPCRYQTRPASGRPHLIASRAHKKAVSRLKQNQDEFASRYVRIELIRFCRSSRRCHSQVKDVLFGKS